METLAQQKVFKACQICVCIVDFFDFFFCGSVIRIHKGIITGFIELFVHLNFWFLLKQVERWELVDWPTSFSEREKLSGDCRRRNSTEKIKYGMAIWRVRYHQEPLLEPCCLSELPQEVDELPQPPPPPVAPPLERLPHELLPEDFL